MNPFTQQLPYRQFLITFIALNGSLSYFFFYYIISVLNSFLSRFFSRSVEETKDHEVSYLVVSSLASLVYIGMSLGSFIAEKAHKLRSRRRYLIISGLMGVIGTSLTIARIDWKVLYAGKLIEGISIGTSLVVVPVYLSELCPPESLKRIGVLSEIVSCFGIICGLLAGKQVQSIHGYDHDGNIDFILQHVWEHISGEWRYVFGAAIAPCAIQIILLLVILRDEPPAYLVSVNKQEQARKFLEKIYLSNATDIDKRMGFLLQDNEVLKLKRSIGIRALFDRKFGKAFLTGVLIRCLKSFTGFIPMLLFSIKLFDKSLGPDGYNPDKAYLYALIAPVVGLVTFIFAFNNAVERDRKPRIVLGYLSIGVLGLLYATVGSFNHYSPILIILLLLWPLIFESGIGIYMQAYLAEVLPDKGVALANFFGYLTDAIVSQFYLYLAYKFGSYSCFLIFGGVSLIAGFLLQALLIESRGRTKSEILSKYSEISIRFIRHSKENPDLIENETLKKSTKLFQLLQKKETLRLLNYEFNIKLEQLDNNVNNPQPVEPNKPVGEVSPKMIIPHLAVSTEIFTIDGNGEQSAKSLIKRGSISQDSTKFEELSSIQAFKGRNSSREGTFSTISRQNLMKKRSSILHLVGSIEEIPDDGDGLRVDIESPESIRMSSDSNSGSKSTTPVQSKTSI
jgi:Sugar (and other) transporter.